MDYKTLLTSLGIIHYTTCNCHGVLTEKFRNAKSVFPRVAVNVFPTQSRFLIIAPGKSAHKQPLSNLANVLNSLYEIG